MKFLFQLFFILTFFIPLYEVHASNLKQFFPDSSAKVHKYEEWTNPGTYTWTRPSGVNVVTVECWGAGGGGGGGATTCGGGCRSAGGGSSGFYVKGDVPVSGNQTVIIGQGGSGGVASTAGAATAGSAGGDSSFGSFVARGGAGGAASAYSGCSGGTITHDLISLGTNYQAKATAPSCWNTSVAGPSTVTGVGGTSVGTTGGNGGAAGKGNGGNGASASGVLGGDAGVAAGGGGGWSYTGTPTNGGAGGKGYCMVTWWE